MEISLPDAESVRGFASSAERNGEGYSMVLFDWLYKSHDVVQRVGNLFVLHMRGVSGRPSPYRP
jgi:hypothetical protein